MDGRLPDCDDHLRRWPLSSTARSEMGQLLASRLIFHLSIRPRESNNALSALSAAQNDAAAREIYRQPSKRSALEHV
jgi:hypothetical protein